MNREDTAASNGADIRHKTNSRNSTIVKLSKLVIEDKVIAEALDRIDT